MCIRHIFICGLSRSTIFFHIYKTARFSKRKKKRVFWFSIRLLPETSFILRITEQDIATNARTSPRKVFRYSNHVLMKLEHSRQNFEKYSSTNFVKIRPVGAGLFHAGGRTDRHDEFFLLLLLHGACCRVTQLLYQPLHIYKMYKIYTLKRFDMFRS